MNNNVYFMNYPTPDDSPDFDAEKVLRERWNDRKKVDFLPLAEDEFYTIVNETDSDELLRMGFSELHMGSDDSDVPIFPPKDKRHFCFPVEWRDIIPDGFEVVALGGDTFPFYAKDYPIDFVIDGCLMVGILRDKSASYELPVINIE